MPETTRPICQSCKRPLYVGAGLAPAVCDNTDCPECDERFLDETLPEVETPKYERPSLRTVLKPWGYTVMRDRRRGAA